MDAVFPGSRLCGLVALVLCALGCSAASAQELAAPPLRELVDENGVDLLTGRFRVSQSDIDIGPPETNLSYAHTAFSSKQTTTTYRASTDVFLKFNSALSPTSASVDIGGSAEKFDVSGSSFTVKNGMGSTLVFDTPSQNYLYTKRDGTVIRFPAKTANEDVNGLRALSILAPDGTLTEFSNLKWYVNALLSYARVQSVTSNAGYQLKLEYGDAARVTLPTKVYALNRTEAYCDPAADTCAATAGAPFATLAWTQAPYDPVQGAIFLLTASDAAGRQTRWTMGAQATSNFKMRGPSGVKSKASSADDITAAFEVYGTGPGGDAVGVTSVVRRGLTWDYEILNYTSTQPSVKVTDPLGNTRQVKTNLAADQVLTDTDALGHVTSYQYDSFGRRTRITYPEGNYIQIAYDTRGNITETRRVAKPGTAPDITQSAVYPTTCSNPKTCNKPTSTTDALGRVTDYTYDATHGGVLTVTEPAPVTGAVRPQTRYGYTALHAWYRNSAGTLVQATTPIYKLTSVSSCRTTASCVNTADEVRTVFSYQTGSSSTPSNLLLASVTQRSGDGALAAVTAFSYDSRGNRVAVDGPLTGVADTITTRYDILRRVAGVVGPDPDGAGALKQRAMRYSYNDDDQPTTVDRGTVDSLSESSWSAFAVLERTTFGYDSAGRKQSASLGLGGALWTLANFSYDAAGRLECTALRMNPATFGTPPASACVLSAAGSFGADRIAKTQYDALGRVSRIQTGYGTPTQRDETSTTYTDNGSISTVTDARNNVTTYEYDRYDLLYKVRYPSASGASSATDFEQFAYDAGGNLVSKRLRDGQLIGFAYDGLNRVQTRDLPGSELDVSYGYDNLGHTTSVAQSGHTLTFGYDALGRLRTQTGPQGTLISDFDTAGRRTRLTWPDAFYVDYGYLITGEMTAVRENGATTGLGLLATYAYDDLGRRTTLTRGNGTTTGYQFDASRLIQLTQNLVATAADQTVGMSYTPAGQIRTRISSNDTYSWSEDQNLSRSYTVNSLNQYATVGGTSLSYDARGNLTNLGMYGYSSENLLTSAPEGVSLSYDPLGRLYQTSSSAGSTRFAYNGDQLVTEYNASNQLLRRYVHGASADEPLVWYEGTGTATRRWLHADERGSIVAISDASGAQFGINRYDEHGIPASGNVGRFQFTGQAWMPEVRLYYFKARFYSASLGRFMQTDPIGYAAGMNLYAYVRGDVINLRDPTGLMETVTTTASRIQSDSFDDYSIYMADFLETILRGLTKNLELTQSTVDGTQEEKPEQQQPCLPDDPPIEQVCPECYLMGVGRLAYAGLAKVIPAIGASVEESAMAQAAYAGAARNSLKDLFRGPLAPALSGIRQPTFSASLVKYNSDPYAIIDAASRTNAAVNAAGATGAALGVGLSVANQKRCGSGK